MLHRLHGIRRVIVCIPVCSLLIFFLTTSKVVAAGNSRLMVFLEVPGSVVSTELALEGLELRNGDHSISLSLERNDLVSENLAGKQILLSSAEVPSGFYSSLHFNISKITGQVGVAEVVPHLRPGGLSVPLDVELPAGQTTTIFLLWRPAAVDPEAEFHSPKFEIQIPVVPPLGSLAFVSSAGSGSVVIINRLTKRVVGALGVGDDPRGLAYSRNNQTLFVALAGQDAIAVVDAMSLRVNNIVPLQFGDDPSRLLLSRDEATLFVLCPGSRTLTSLSAWSMQQQFRVAVGEGPRSIAQDPVSGKLYVACEDEGRVQIVDPGSVTITNSLTLMSAPVEVVIDEQSRLLFLGGSAQRSIRSFDLASDESGGDQNICGIVSGLAVNPRSRRLYASVPSCRNLAVIRPDVGIEFGSINLPGSPGLIAFDQAYRQLWVVMPEQGALAVCNANMGQLETVIQVGSDPYQVLLP
ncbi:MAG: YncE family protein [Candidatus Krumholzibacteria bacterium]|nr:YncE family protein [Candidatus Krumholzibacteria bacterium]